MKVTLGFFYLKRCATTAGPYQSPAIFPDLFPYSMSRCKPKFASGESPNQEIIFRWQCSSFISLFPQTSFGTFLWWIDWFLHSLSPVNDASSDEVSFFTVWLVHDSESKFSMTNASGQVQSVTSFQRYYKSLVSSQLKISTQKIYFKIVHK